MVFMIILSNVRKSQSAVNACHARVSLMLAACFVISALGVPMLGVAASYGTFDPRSLAMGGATVAAGSSSHAHFYNPALLSFENEDEDLSRNGRLILPGFSALYSDAGQSAVDLVEQDLDENISRSIDQFNASPTSTEAAQGVLTALNEFDEAISQLNQQNIELDVYVGLSVSEPAEREGGSFYFGARALVFGEVDVTSEDLAELDAYIDIAERLTAGESIATLNDGDRVVNNQVVDPRPSLTSEARLSSLVIGEWGVALSKEFSVLGQNVAFGATPKIMQVQVYREDADFQSDIASYSENRGEHLTMNVDLGVAAELFDHYRVGVAVRDVLPKTFNSDNNLDVNLRPRPRLGLAYVNDFITLGLDVDLQEIKPLATESESQEVALGIELSPWDAIDIRFGYRQDLASEREDIISAGVRYQVWRFVGEAAFAVSDEVTGGALQLGWAF